MAKKKNDNIIIYNENPKLEINYNKNRCFYYKNKFKKYSSLNKILAIQNDFSNKREDKSNSKDKNKIQNIIPSINYIKLINVLTAIIIISQIAPIGNSTFSKITLNIRGIGIKKIFGSNFESINFPDEVKINGVIQNFSTFSYNFTQENNYVELIWYNNINNCANMFYGCSDITEIDFSNFDTSEVANMNSMFNGCSSLTSLHLSRFITSNVTSMTSLFNGCKELTSLDLSDFDTRKVTNMDSMFNGCLSLPSLHLSNFDTRKVTNMDSMFNRCSLLTSLDLSQFHTSNVKSMSSLFNGCRSLVYLDLSRFDTSEVIKMNSMFYGCSSLTSLDLSRLNTSKVTNMDYMFGCPSLTSLDLSNFKTQNVVNMESMFSGCMSLKSLNLFNFNTSSVTNMCKMFDGCLSLIYLNISSFNISKVKNLSFMFGGCSSITSLDLYNFGISKVTNIDYMFNKCSSLKFLNLSNFDSSFITEIGFLFNECENLEYINFKNFKGSGSINCYYVFEKVPDNIIGCINENNHNLLIALRNKNCYGIDCTDDWKLNQKKIVNKTGICIDINGKNVTFKYEFQGKYYENCNNGNLVSNSIIRSCKCDKEKCLFCPNEPLTDDLCLQCNNGFYPVENNNSSIGAYINCYYNPIGYYLDKNESLYKKCFYTCKSCEIKGNNLTHNCLKCNNDFPISIQKNKFNNCYHNCSYYHFLDIYDNYHCTDNYSCPNDYPILIDDNLECVKDFIFSTELENSNIKQEFSDIIINDQRSIIIDTNSYTTSETDSKENLSSIINEFSTPEIFNETKYGKDRATIIFETQNHIKNILDELKNLSENIIKVSEFNTILEINKNNNLDNRQDNTIETEDYYNVFTTNENHKSNINITIIVLNECIILLEKFYNISNKETLDMIQEGMKTQKIDYKIYFGLSGINVKELNLSFCEKILIDISIPKPIIEPIDKININSGYYNDICYTATSDSGTDILLKDRIKEYFEINKTICPNNCDFIEYDNINKKVKCLCKIKNFLLNDNKASNKTMFLNKFYNNENHFGNFNILKCYKSLFCKKGISQNIGFFLLIIIFIFHFIYTFYFYLKDIYLIKNKIGEITDEIKQFQIININKKRIYTELKPKENINKGEIKIDKKEINSRKKRKRDIKNKTKKNTVKRKDINKSDGNNIEIFVPEEESIRKIIYSNQRNHNIIETINDVMSYNDNEKNILSYDLAKKYDKRSFCIYYISLIKTKHNLISLFFNENYYNLKLLKLDLLLLLFTLCYVINILFFSENLIHIIYEHKGSYNLKYHFSEIIYSSLISRILLKLLELLISADNAIFKYKQNRSCENIYRKKKNLIYKLNIKFIIYFIIFFLFLLIFWYYISMFGAIYINTQYHLLKDVLITFVLSLVYPFVIHLFAGLFRILSLSNSKKDTKFLYNFSKVIQMF